MRINKNVKINHNSYGKLRTLFPFQNSLGHAKAFLENLSEIWASVLEKVRQH